MVFHSNCQPRMVQSMYRGSQCAVVDGGGKTDWFDIKLGVQKGCIMSGFLFLVVIDWVMRQAVEEENTEIGQRFTRGLLRS